MERILIRSQDLLQGIPAEVSDNQIGVGYTAVVLSADAQATIAALQARVKELEQAVKETHGRFISEQAAKKDVIDELTVALKSDADGQVLIDKLMQDVLKLESQLTQRTAELEAAKAELEQERVRLASCLIAAEGGTKDIVKQGDYGWSPAYQATLNLQAELERVRADNKALDEWRADVTVSLQRPGGAFFVDVPQHIKDLVKERDDLRTLLLALPKVEGAVVVSNGYVKDSTRCHALFGADEDAALYAALLQHRQWMEG